MEDLDSDSSSSSSWEDVEDDEGDGDRNEQLCHPLLLNSLVLEKIFEFLPICDLLSCRLVSRDWNKTALLRALLGSKFEITVTKGNFDGLLKTAHHSVQPFCRKFDFRNVELDYDKVSKFIRLFGDRVSTLSIKFCSASSVLSVAKILNCPRLEELKICGALPEIKEENVIPFKLFRLRSLTLVSSLDYGQISENFIKIILKHAPNLSYIHVGQSMSLWTDFCKAVSPPLCSKLCHVALSGMEDPIQIHFFEELKHLIPERIDLRNCLVAGSFLEELFQQNFKNLTVISVEGTQQEILTRSFHVASLPNLRRLKLPVDGVSLDDGCFILQSSPKLRSLIVIGLLQTKFNFIDGRLISVVISENKRTYIPLPHNIAGDAPTRQEFLKILSLFQQQPQRLEVNLAFSNIQSQCIRSIFTLYPDLEHLNFTTSCFKECLVGFTGIPYKLCQRRASCRSFSVSYPEKIRTLQSSASLKKLKSFKLTMLDETPAELALVFILYGICGMSNLTDLSLHNFVVSDVSLMMLAQKLNLSSCAINGSEKIWKQFLASYKKQTIKSFLLPPPEESNNIKSPGEMMAFNRNILLKIFSNMNSNDVYGSRQVCKRWHAVSTHYLHAKCVGCENNLTSDLENRLSQFYERNGCPQSPRNRFYMSFRETRIPTRSKVLQFWKSITMETSLVLVSLSPADLDFFQADNHRPARKRLVTCQKRRQLEYWCYPDGSDELIYRPNQEEGEFDLEKISDHVQTLFVIGCWGKKDYALHEFLNPTWSLGSIYLIGLPKEALDLVLPKLTAMMNLEKLEIKPFMKSTPYSELTKTHLHILCNASFKLRELALHSFAPSDSVAEFIRSQRYTLETIEIRSNVNVSDRLTFLMPELKVLFLDEPSGKDFWTTLHVHSSLETINFGRSGSSCNQVKIKSSPKINPVDADFEHSATELLCDINWFLENATSSPRRLGAQKSILQQGSDSALKFFMHFPYLSSLTLRGVHAHYGILQGIFKKFVRLKKLELINANGVTDEILTGFPKEILDEMDIMNPFQSIRKRRKTEVKGKSNISIRNLKGLTHLNLDDQTSCTDFSVIFGILKLHNLEYFSCKKWKITDVSLRAIADLLPSLKEVNTEGCSTVSKLGVDYFEESRSRNRTKPSSAGLTRSSSSSSTLSKSSVSEAPTPMSQSED